MSLGRDLISEVQFECSICLDIFSDPASLPCGHSFCRACIAGYWDSADLCQCPLCKESYPQRPKLCINRSLSQFTEFFEEKKKKKEEETGGASGSEQPRARPGEVACDVCVGTRLRAARSCLVCLASYCEGHLASHRARFSRHPLVEPLPNMEDRMCPKHQRPLELFCKSERACVCVQCARPDHGGHTVVSVEDAVQEFKTLLAKSVAETQLMIHERVRKVEEIGQSVELSKASAERENAAGSQIIDELLNSIAAVRSGLTAAIEEQQRVARRRAEGLVKELDREICELKGRNSDLDQLLHTKDCVHFLQSFSSLGAPPHMKDWSNIAVHTDLCLDTTRTAISKIEKTLNKLLQKLTESELRRVQKSAVDVTLDPSTANRWLVLSEDGKRVREGDGARDVPDDPGRFSDCACVLGRDGFSSGRRYWEVRVGDKTDWDLGVASQSACRRGDVEVSPEEGYWTMCLRDGAQYSACADLAFALSPRAAPRTVGVYVDHEAGRISFYDVDARSHLYTFRGTFRGKLYPFFSPYLSDGARNSAPLIISPFGISTTE